MRSLPRWPSRAAAIGLTFTIVLAAVVLGFSISRSAEGNPKPGHGNGHTTPPETTITAGPAEGSIATQADVSFSFSSSEVKSTFDCQLDSGGFSPCTSPNTYHGLSNGSHTFEVKATNRAGTDATPATRTWTVDATTQGGTDPVMVGAGDIANCSN